ncbi:hypothetical protein [Desulfosporosinus youngiae]|uniref:Uncharacterized protein n=1 Tax=Desulfosporosinus youngiae DSM 17734 TaxID=768710 RepID=H5Y3C5_9FIRM|nr:hypothetical protein [Desulfosporosinus youngiae]EHQ88894.1 hypothetical protein DesyoDRAFT_1766 [Desulfosporosinus youngiae DSM 17734]
MEIKIGIGLDCLVFGMSQKEVEDILGKPDKTSETEKDKGIVYYFYDKLIKTKFDKEEDLKLYSIEVHNPDVKMFKKKLINKTKGEIESLLLNNGYKKIEYEDYDTFDIIFCEEIWTTFEFELNRLKNIEFSPLFKDSKNIIWPNRIYHNHSIPKEGLNEEG